MEIPEFLHAEEGLSCHTESAEDSDSSPKHFFFFKWTSHSLHLSKQLDRCEHTAVQVTGGRVSHRDCITPCWLLHTGRVRVCTLEPTAPVCRSISEGSVVRWGERGYHLRPSAPHRGYYRLGAEWQVNRLWLTTVVLFTCVYLAVW